jgi:hypothetical protein
LQEYVEFVSNKVEDLDKKVSEIEKQETTTIGNLFGSLLGKSKQNKPKGEPIAFVSTDYYMDPVIVKDGVKTHEKKHEEWRATKKAEQEEKEKEKKNKSIEKSTQLETEVTMEIPADITPSLPDFDPLPPPDDEEEEKQIQSVAPTPIESGVEAEGEE